MRLWLFGADLVMCDRWARCKARIGPVRRIGGKVLPLRVRLSQG
jgi:hypothetical protein